MYKHAIAVVVSLCSVPLAYAHGSVGDKSEQPFFSQGKERGWAVQVTPYLWATGLSGKISPFQHAPTIDVDKSFSDVMKDLKVGGFINLWGRHGRFVFSGDVMYVNTKDSEGAGPLSAFQIPGLGVTFPAGASVDAKVNSKQFTATAQGGYRVVATPQFTLDVLGGVRFWYISNDVAVTTSHAAIGSRSASHGESFRWMDPLVGIRAFLPITEDLSFQVQADVGGFGAGSKHTWSTLATVNYVFSDRFSASAGYKALDVKYDRSGHVYDTRMSGPVIGLTYRF